MPERERECLLIWTLPCRNFMTRKKWNRFGISGCYLLTLGITITSKVCPITDVLVAVRPRGSASVPNKPPVSPGEILLLCTTHLKATDLHH
jgi:hypothetical protein